MASKRAPLARDLGEFAMLHQIIEGDINASILLSPLQDRSDKEITQICEHLADMNIRGGQIAVAIEMCCDGDLDSFISRISERDASLVAFLNDLTPPFPHKAVVGGGEQQLKGE